MVFLQSLQKISSPFLKMRNQVGKNLGIFQNFFRKFHGKGIGVMGGTEFLHILNIFGVSGYITESATRERKQLGKGTGDKDPSFC